MRAFIIVCASACVSVWLSISPITSEPLKAKMYAVFNYM